MYTMLFTLLFTLTSWAEEKDGSSIEKSQSTEGNTSIDEDPKVEDNASTESTAPLRTKENSATIEEIASANAEITVYGQREVDRRRELLDQQLEQNGYRQGIRRDNKVVYRPETVWHPSVIVYDSGWVDVRKTPPRFEPWIGGNPDNKWRYLSCIPPFGLMCIKASGWLITKRRAQHSKTAVVENNIESIQFWQESVFGLAHQHRIDVELPEQLEQIWQAPTYSNPEKMEQIVLLWSTRTCTPEGAQAAGLIADFLAYEVHPIQPLPSETILWMQEHNECAHSMPPID